MMSKIFAIIIALKEILRSIIFIFSVPKEKKIEDSQKKIDDEKEKFKNTGRPSE